LCNEALPGKTYMVTFVTSAWAVYTADLLYGMR
jgi:hypothetical protein